MEEFFPKIMRAGKNIVQDIRKKKKQRGKTVRLSSAKITLL